MTLSRQTIQQASLQRDALVQALHRLHLAWMAPQRNRTQQWCRELCKRLEKVVGLLEEHAGELEQGRGLLAQIAEEEPRLLNQVEQLSQEHRQLVEQAIRLKRQACNFLQSGGDANAQPASVQELRESASRLVQHLRHHHARENDLIFEAIHTVLGAGD